MNSFAVTADYESDDLMQLSLQPGFVEGIVRDKQSFTCLSEAYRYVFRRNREYAILLWNGLPVRLSYIDDIPVLVQPLLEMLEFIRKSENFSIKEFILETQNFSVTWWLSFDGDRLSIKALWRNIEGNYQAALNEFDTVCMQRTVFLNEWKLLLAQLVQAGDEAGVKFEKESKAVFNRLKKIERAIDDRGKFYQYG